MKNIRVISSDKDGADLRREVVRNKYHVRCYGTSDDREISEAISSLGVKQYSGLGDNWERIFK